MAPSNEDGQSATSPGLNRASMRTFHFRTTSAFDGDAGKKAPVDYYKVVKARQNLLFIEKEN